MLPQLQPRLRRDQAQPLIVIPPPSPPLAPFIAASAQELPLLCLKGTANALNFYRKSRTSPLNGRLMLSTPNPLSFPVVFFEMLRNKHFFYTKEHTYYFSPRWMERILTLSGYKVQLVKGVGLWAPFITLPCPVFLSYQVIYVATPSDSDSRDRGGDRPCVRALRCGPNQRNKVGFRFGVCA